MTDLGIIIFGILKFTPAFRDKQNLISIQKILIVMQIIITILMISKFILSLLLYHYIESGDAGKYDELLDCKFVKKIILKHLLILILLEKSF